VNWCSALLAAGQPDSSICAQALLAAPEDPAAMLGLAAAALAENNPVVALRTLGSMHTARGSSPEQWQEAARLFGVLGDWSAACAAYIRGGGGGVAGARSCIAAGRVDEALKILEPLAGEDADAAFFLGTLALERALGTDPGPERQRAVADAWRRFRASENAHAQKSDWHNNVGRLQALDGDAEAAESSFRRALELAPGAAFPSLNLARLLEAQGRHEEAWIQLERVMQAGGELGAMAGLDLARRAVRSGRQREAEELASEVLQACEQAGSQTCVVEACIVLGGLLAGTQRERALQLLLHALELAGQSLRPRLEVEPELRTLLEEPAVKALLGDTP